MKTVSLITLTKIRHSIYNNFETVINSLFNDTTTLIKWFNDNYFKMNADKCQLLITNHEEQVSIKIDSESISGKKWVKLLGIKIDNKLDFNEHV